MKNPDELQTILIVEDSDDDYEIMTEGLAAESRIRNPVLRCEDGREALAYLLREGDYSDPQRSPAPGIILLDLNLPGIDGREVLRRIKGTPRLRRIPVVVLTTSDDERDVEDCYELGANSYIQKPVDLDKFLFAIRQLTDYWLGIAILPKD
ncbi:response regulator [Halomonas denitrificans]|nr:response regulator [Halomonas denitrificans]